MSAAGGDRGALPRLLLCWSRGSRGSRGRRAVAARDPHEDVGGRPVRCLRQWFVRAALACSVVAEVNRQNDSARAVVRHSLTQRCRAASINSGFLGSAWGRFDCEPRLLEWAVRRQRHLRTCGSGVGAVEVGEVAPERRSGSRPTPARMCFEGFSAPKRDPRRLRGVLYDENGISGLGRTVGQSERSSCIRGARSYSRNGISGRERPPRRRKRSSGRRKGLSSPQTRPFSFLSPSRRRGRDLFRFCRVLVAADAIFFVFVALSSPRTRFFSNLRVFGVERCLSTVWARDSRVTAPLGTCSPGTPR